MIELKNKTRDLYSFSDTDLLMQMSWKDDPASRSEAAFTVFQERYENLTWPIIHQVCGNYVPHHGLQLPMEVFNNTFMMVYEQPLVRISHFEAFSCAVQLGSEVELWLTELAGDALRELMNSGYEAWNRHHVLNLDYVSSNSGTNNDLENEDNVPYNSDELLDDPSKKSAETNETVDLSLSFEPPNQEEADEDKPEEAAYTAEQLAAVSRMLATLSPRDREIVVTLMAYEVRGHKTPREVLEALRIQYGMTSDNLRAVKSRALKQLRAELGVTTKLRI